MITSRPGGYEGRKENDMKIKFENKIYTLDMRVWDNDNWIILTPEDIVVDSSYKWEDWFWTTDSTKEDLIDFLDSWKDYSLEERLWFDVGDKKERYYSLTED